MKTWINPPNTQQILLSTILIMLFQLPALASTTPVSVISTSDFKEIFSTLVLKDNSPLGADNGRKRKIVNFSSQPKTIELPAGAISYKTISQTAVRQRSYTNPPQSGRQIVWLAVRVNGQEQAKVKLTGDIQLFGNVVCLSRALRRHAILSLDDVEIVQKNISILGADFIADPQLVIGRELRTTLQPGATLYGRLLKNPTMVSRGALVSILARSGALTIKAAGQIKTSGALGDIVQVKNLMSRHEIYARVISPSEVQVEF